MERSLRWKHRGFSFVELIAATVIMGMIFSGAAVLRVSQTEYAKKSQSEREISA